MRHNPHLTRSAHVRAAWLMLCCALLAACQLPALSGAAGAPGAPAAPAAPDSDLVSALLAATPTPDALAESARATLETSLASAASGTTRFGGSTGSAGAPAAAPPLALQDAVATSVAATLTAQPTPTPNATATAAAYAAQLAAAVAATLTAQPTATPTATPTNTPTPTPSDTPSPTPSPTPTATPSNTPSPTPSDTPSPTPSRTPRPTDTPTHTPRPTPIPAPRAWGFRSCASPCLPDGANATQSIPGPAYKVHATWHYENIPPGAHYQRIWSMSDLGEWVRYDCAWDGPTAGMDSVALSEPMGLRAGWWQVRIVVDDREILNENVLVEGSQTYWEPVGVLWKCRGNK